MDAGIDSQPRTADADDKCAFWVSMSHSGKRLRISSSAIRASSLASAAPRQK